VPGLFEQRQVDHRRGVAHGARVAVPVPRPAEVAAALDDANVVDTGLLPAGPRRHPGEPAADARHGALVADRRPPGTRHIRILDQVGEATGRLDVLVVAVRPEPLVALGAVPGP